jgi:hypothetical protein
VTVSFSRTLLFGVGNKGQAHSVAGLEIATLKRCSIMEYKKLMHMETVGSEACN